MDNIRIKPAWPKSKEAIWNEKFAHLDERKPSGQTVRSPFKSFIVNYQLSIVNLPSWAYAAAIVFAVLLTGVLYTTTKTTARGEQAVVYLPDRSTVTLNADSKLSYKPFVWFISRKAQLTGEACFEVIPGSRFTVQSGQNRVNVLGTTFNVYTRSGIYRVTCLAGQVSVSAGGESVVLIPNMQATFTDRGISFDSNITPSTTTGWMQGKFDYEGAPLSEVIAEVERQYNITVIQDYDPNLLFSGNFSKTGKPEETLEIIGKAFGINLKIE